MKSVMERTTPIGQRAPDAMLPRAYDLSSWHHNAFGGFLSLRIALFAAGQGTAEFRNFRYTEI